MQSGFVGPLARFFNGGCSITRLVAGSGLRVWSGLGLQSLRESAKSLASLLGPQGACGRAQQPVKALGSPEEWVVSLVSCRTWQSSFCARIGRLFAQQWAAPCARGAAAWCTEIGPSGSSRHLRAHRFGRLLVHVYSGVPHIRFPFGGEGPLWILGFTGSPRCQILRPGP